MLRNLGWKASFCRQCEGGERAVPSVGYLHGRIGKFSAVR